MRSDRGRPRGEEKVCLHVLTKCWGIKCEEQDLEHAFSMMGKKTSRGYISQYKVYGDFNLFRETPMHPDHQQAI